MVIRQNVGYLTSLRESSPISPTYRQELKSCFERLIKTCRQRSQGDDTGGYLAIFDIFKEAILQLRPRHVDSEVQNAAASLQQKCDLLLAAAKNNAERVSLKGGILLDHLLWHLPLTHSVKFAMSVFACVSLELLRLLVSPCALNPSRRWL